MKHSVVRGFLLAFALAGCSDPAASGLEAPNTEALKSQSCPYNVGDYYYCYACGPCAEGEGWCHNDNHCEQGLECTPYVGWQYGYSEWAGVCEAAPCPYQPGDDGYCSCGLCGEGEGDCDTDADCEAGLVCAHDVGASYGWSPSVDVCEQACPWQPGDEDYCLDCGPCGEGEGDCDSDSDCQPGTTCVQDVGASYGWAPTVDVCEAGDDPNSCVASSTCGGRAPGGCWCDAACVNYGDCCDDGPC